MYCINISASFYFLSASLVSGQETEIRTLQRKLARRDNEILRQERELHKLRVSLNDQIDLGLAFKLGLDNFLPRVSYSKLHT